MLDLGADAAKALLEGLSGLRDRVTGVLGSVIGGVDGLLIIHDMGEGLEPHDLAALAAASLGIGRHAGKTLRQGQFQESTIHSQSGYFVVYAVGDTALLAVSAADGLNLARLHLEARKLVPQLSDVLAAVPVLDE